MSSQQILDLLDRYPLYTTGSGFLSEDDAPMKLCLVCKRISIPTKSQLLESTVIDHYQNYDQLVEAAVGGCDLCALLLVALLRKHSPERHCLREEAQLEARRRETSGDLVTNATLGDQDRVVLEWVLRPNFESDSWFDAMINWLQISIHLRGSEFTTKFTPRWLPGIKALTPQP